MKNLPLLYRTLRDIPAGLLLKRLNYELKIRTISKLPENTREQIILGKTYTPPVRKSYLNTVFISNENAAKFKGKQSFEFLKEKREFTKIIWNSAGYSRLWQFQLHYFDYLTNDLNLVYAGKLKPDIFLAKTQYLMNDWIENNAFYSLDGWHPYTSSLRLVNWVYSFKAFPNLAGQEILASTWKQLLYLSKNKETFAGGNHLLENLRAIIIAGLYFDNPESESMVNKAILQLKGELKKQILADGGHYELSSSYHLLMTKLLAEVVVAIKSAAWNVPEIFISKLGAMLEFAKAIRLPNGSYPLWNDASFDSAPAIDVVISFASALLDKAIPGCVDNSLPQLFTKLLQTASTKPHKSSEVQNQVGLSKLSASGYYIFRSKEQEISFDAALPGPKELPGHAHADCLSFNLYKNGEPLIVETGVSQYGSGKIRSYERSTAAHNTVVINNQNQSEIWGGFRVGAKAKPINARSGRKEDLIWASAGHDGYDKINARHFRWLGHYDEKTIIIDKISGHGEFKFSSYLHFAPNQEASITNNVVTLQPSGLNIEVVSNQDKLQIELAKREVSESYYSPEMGLKIARAKLTISGMSSKAGDTAIVCMVFHFKEQISDFSFNKRNLSLQFSDKSLKWVINDREIHLVED